MRAEILCVILKVGHEQDTRYYYDFDSENETHEPSVHTPIDQDIAINTKSSMFVL